MNLETPIFQKMRQTFFYVREPIITFTSRTNWVKSRRKYQSPKRKTKNFEPIMMLYGMNQLEIVTVPQTDEQKFQNQCTHIFRTMEGQLIRKHETSFRYRCKVKRIELEYTKKSGCKKMFTRKLNMFQFSC